MRRFCALLLLAAAAAAAQTPKRLVVLKVDGLPQKLVDQYVNERDPLSGKSRLPWIDRIFHQQGTYLENFYVRGISLSAPSWSMLDTGQHLVIRGNAEYDRYTMRVYDYLNFFPFYVNYARSRRVDMPGVEVLDEAGVPLLIDRYNVEQRYQGLQLYQRGILWKTLQGTLVHRITSRSPSQLFNEWQLGFEMGRGLSEQIERELVQKLNDPKVLYLDFFFGDYDHIGHLTNDAAAQYVVIKRLDALAGRIWTAIQASPLAQQTIFVLLSDHGMNTDPAVYSQGYSLIDFFGSAEAGGHHVLTNRHPLTEYKIKGLDPFVSQVVTPSAHSYYLRDHADDYPTALLDLDGNERASVHLRNDRLNEIHILLERLSHNDLKREQRAFLSKAVLEIIEEQRASWDNTLTELDAELAALRRRIARQESLVKTLPRKWTNAERTAGDDRDARREIARLHSWEEDETGYTRYARALNNLLKIEPNQLDATKLKIDALVPRRVMGDPNTIYDLQNYAIARDGGAFRRVNYFELLTGIRVRNNVQTGVGNRPVDFVAVRAPLESLAGTLDLADRPDQDAVWIYQSETSQALILARGRDASLQLRYLPVQGLKQDRSGRIMFTIEPWRAGLPLNLFEDPELHVAGEPAEWLNQWHTQREWLDAVHRTVYSNAVIGLHEQLSRMLPPPSAAPVTADDMLLRRFEQRKRNMAQADMLVLAADHWNFNVRGFNPGGNHGSFFRMSTHSVLMLAGAGVPEGLAIVRPYDSLSFVPTLLSIAGLAQPGELEKYPGPLIRELVSSKPVITYNCCR